MKKFILLLNVFMLCFACIACGVEKTESGTERAAQSAIGSAIQIIPPHMPQTDYLNLAKNLVTDAYTYDLKIGEGTTFNYNIPQINIDSEDAKEINAKIYNDLYYGTIRQNVFNDISIGNDVPVCMGISYKWYINSGIVSLVITETFDADVIRYSAYNLQISKGEKVSDEDIILSKMASLEEYRTHVKRALGSIVWNQYGDTISSWQSSYDGELLTEARAVLSSTISETNIDSCIPYLGENGDLYIIGDVYSLAGASKYSHIVNLNNYELAKNYSDTIEIPVRTKLTEDQAREMASKYWEIKPGDKSEEGHN